MNLCLNMIVRNEGERIERALRSAAPYIKSWVIIDTGSTDDTKERIMRFFAAAGIPGEIRDEPFIDFSQARNAALSWARKLAPFYQPDYFLLMDADMELVVKDPERFNEQRSGLSFMMFQKAGPVSYANTRIVNAITDHQYRGVTHEYLDVDTSGTIPETVAYFRDHADGSNRIDKYKRDIRLLKAGLKEEPNNVRYFYYLASSYRDAGKPAEAAKWFKRRVLAGGWAEEAWHAQLCYAHCLKDLGDLDGFVRNLLDAYNMRPSRAEPMYDLARFYRDQKAAQPAALAAAEAVEHLPKSGDSLFVNEYVYDVGIKEEISICSAYVPGKFEKGRRATDELSMLTSHYHEARRVARHNHFYYIRPLGEECPSFKHVVLSPPAGMDDWAPLNPSVVLDQGRVLCNLRMVNYRIDGNGAYLIRGTDGTANRENPIDTRNFIVDLGTDPLKATLHEARECYRPGNLPCEFPLVTGFEDVRLFPWRGELWSSATVRQIAADGQCEQVLSRIEGGVDGYRHVDVKRMLRTPRETEKNWAPIISPRAPYPRFMWRPGVVIDSDGEVVLNHRTKFATDNLSGSSQVIPWGENWLAVLHSAHPLPGEDYKRYYHHRFVEYTPDFRVKRLSLPWCFHDRVIEFCAGMCWNSEDRNNSLVLSYGYKDCEARIATVSANDVRVMLDGGHNG